MSSFTANMQNYNVVTENEVAVVLSHYNSDFVFSIVDNAMKRRFLEVPIIAVPNVVGAWEQNFKAIRAQYGAENNEEIMRVRNETYKEIIDDICGEFKLSFTIDDTVDLYSAAYHLYDLFVCKFIENMTTFFANYIYKERSSIYDSLGLADKKKNKDSSTIYGKKIYKDIKLAVINANIDMVVSEICSMDIPFASIISLIYGSNSELKRYIISIVSADSDFMDNVYVPVMNSFIRPDIITSIRFKLQEIAMAHDQAINGFEIEVAVPSSNNDEENA